MLRISPSQDVLYLSRKILLKEKLEIAKIQTLEKIAS
jgi:hypothetical protein